MNSGQTLDQDYFTNGKLNNIKLLKCIEHDSTSDYDGESQWDGFEGYKYLRNFMATYAHGMEDRDIVEKIDEDVLLQFRSDNTPVDDKDTTRTKSYRQLEWPSSSRMRVNQMVHVSHYTCNKCEKYWNSWEVRDELLLKNPGSVNKGIVGLEVLIRDMLCSKTKEKNMHCVKCKKKNGCYLQQSIILQPKNLVFQIGRIDFEKKRKDNTRVDVPIKDLYFQGEVYDLILAMHHKPYNNDDSGDSGHYFVHRLYKNSWYRCDDEKVSSIQDDKIREQLLKHGETISALFYLRREKTITNKKDTIV